MNKFSKYVAGIALATMIGCSDRPANQVNSEASDLEVCTQELATTTGYSGDFAADYNTNVLRPRGVKVDVANPQLCLAARLAFNEINPSNLPLSVSEDLVISLDNADVSAQYLDALIAEANDPANNLVSSYLGDSEWLKEFVESPIDAYLCDPQNLATSERNASRNRGGKVYETWNKVDPNNQQRIFAIDLKKWYPGMISARLNGVYGVADSTDRATIESVISTLGHSLDHSHYWVNAADCPENNNQ